MTVQNQLSISTWNMRGFKSSVPYVRKLIEENDIVLLNEHWLHHNRLHLFNEYFSDVEVFARASKFSGADAYGGCRGQGGVAVIWGKHLSGVVPITEVIHDRICGIRIQLPGGNGMNIFSIYMPAVGCGEDLGCSLDELAGIIESRPPGDITILGGDFNGDLGYDGGRRGIRSVTKRGKLVLSMMGEYDFIACNLEEEAKGPVCTYHGPFASSCIDYIMIPSDLAGVVDKCLVIEEEDLNVSDHLPIKVVLNIEMIPRVSISNYSTSSIKWSKTKIEQIFEEYTHPLSDSLRTLNARFGQPIERVYEIDGMVNWLVKEVHKSAANLPRTNYKKHIKPFWSHELTVLKKNKVDKYRKWVSEGRPRGRDNILYREYMDSKKTFLKRLKFIANRYENEQILEVMKSAEIDKTHLWRQLKKVRGGITMKVLGIKGADGKVKHEIQEVLRVWKEHFQKVGTPKNDPKYDQEHFVRVNDFVEQKMALKDNDQFSEEEFGNEEVKKAIMKLNRGKAPGPDLVTAEHLIYGGDVIVSCLTKIFNLMREHEYIPISFRRGTQIPLYKGKNTCSLNPSNYRGITLLSTLNKVYEIVLWQRMEHWWTENKVICGLQGAGKKGFSCLHSSLMLQETLATSMEENQRCFSVYFDVAKAYDTVWINGLFFQLFKLGIRGKTWRMLRKCYDNFMCRVRVMGHFSEWYELTCGIHQGGFLSLIKYVAFTNSLLEEIRDSGLCCQIYRTPSVPVGYADDMAAACPNKHNIDLVISKAYQHGCTWRYDFNAAKSAVLVIGETRKDWETNSKFREFSLGGTKVKEKESYEHLGVVSTVHEDDSSRVRDRLSKARKVLNMASGIGIKRKGLSMYTCNVIFWGIVVPTALFGCEIWCLTASDIGCIEEFQVYAGKRVQRLHPRTPNICSFASLGWIHLDVLILIRKVIFIRTIMVMKDEEVVKIVFRKRVQKFCENPNKSMHNEGRSPIFDIMHAAVRLEMVDAVLDYIEGIKAWSKTEWKNMVWKHGWFLNDRRNDMMLNNHKDMNLLKVVFDKVAYICWWSIADIFPNYMYFCETMVKLLSHSSRLKADSFALKSSPRSLRVCTRCFMGQLDDAKHMITQCDDTQEERTIMQNEIQHVLGEEFAVIRNINNIFPMLLGHEIEGLSDEGTLKLRLVTGTHIHRMYQRRTRVEEGVG